MANIKNNNYRKFSCRILNDYLIDLMLSKDNVKTPITVENEIATKLNFNNIQNKHVISEIAWKNAVPSNKILKNIGYTGVDNGFISYERDRIGNDEFLDLFTNSTFDLSKYDNKFFVTEVSGNTGMFKYPIEKYNEYATLKGGFYQGFFKIECDKYKTLPLEIEDEWNFNFTLRCQDYITPVNIMNKRHPENSGIFFYIGTRAENKFWEFYKHLDNIDDFKNADDDYTTDYDLVDFDVIKKNYLDNKSEGINTNTNNNTNNDFIEPDNDYNDYNDYFDDNSYFVNEDKPVQKNQNNNIEKDDIDFDYFNDAYAIEDNANDTCEISTLNEENDSNIKFDCIEEDSIFESDYLIEQMSLDDIKLKDSKGYDLNEKGFYEIKTDNKFIIFNNTKNGFNINNWNENNEFIITGKTDAPNINYFTYLNKTSSGYIKDNIDKIINEHSYAYDIFKDIENNALCLKINEDKSISYRYLSDNCELIEEKSKPNVIPNNEWFTIHFKIVRKSDKMQLYIYVDGYLKLISKELSLLNLRGVNDLPERQEGVPYTISIGGGTIGLGERIILDYYNSTNYCLPIEKNFAGTFIGDIKSFSFIPKYVDFYTISQKS